MKKSIFKKMTGMVLLALLTACVAGCTTYDNFKAEFIDDEKPDTVKIAVYEPLTGPDKQNAEKEIEGIELANSIYPTVDGKKVELIYGDNRSDTDVGTTVIQDLISKNPSVILGSYGNVNTLAASQFIEQAQIPAITMTNINPIITSTSNYYFRVCYVDTYQGIGLAEYAYKGLKCRKTAVMVPAGDEQAAAIAQKYMARFTALTGKESSIVINLEYEAGELEYSEQLNEIKKSGAKSVLLLAGTDDAAEILKEADELGLSISFLGTDEWDIDSMIEKAGAGAVSKAKFTKITDIEAVELKSKSYSSFLESYQSMYGKDQVPDSATALGYDAYMIAITAIGRAGSDVTGSELRDEIAATEGYSGASGVISFNNKGDAEKSVTIYSVNAETGGSEPVYIVEKKK